MTEILQSLCNCVLHTIFHMQASLHVITSLLPWQQRCMMVQSDSGHNNSPSPTETEQNLYHILCDDQLPRIVQARTLLLCSYQFISWDYCGGMHSTSPSAVFCCAATGTTCWY